MDELNVLLYITLIPAFFILLDAIISIFKNGVKLESKRSFVIRLAIFLLAFNYFISKIYENINPLYITFILVAITFLFLYKRRNVDYYTIEKFDFVQCEEILDKMLSENKIKFDKRYEKVEQWTRDDVKVVYELNGNNGQIELEYNDNKKYPTIRMAGIKLEDPYLLQDVLPVLREAQSTSRIQTHALYQVILGFGLAFIGILPNI